MAGYSSTPLWRKLGIKAGYTVALMSAPNGWEIEGLPEGVVLQPRAGEALDVVVAFFDQRSEVEHQVPALTRAIRADGSLWIAWPRKAAGHVSDISENALRDIVLPTGLVDVKVAALDDDWSGLKFVWRKVLRPASAKSPVPSNVRERGAKFHESLCTGLQ